MRTRYWSSTINEFDSKIISNIPFLKRIASKYVNNTEDKEDLVQNTIYRALKNRNKFKENSNIKGWLATILRNIFINQYHEKKSYKKTIDIELVNLAFEDTISTTSVHDIYWQSLNQLSPECTLLILMTDIEGFSHSQIAEFLNCSVCSIRTRLYNCRKKMLKKYRKMIQ